MIADITLTLTGSVLEWIFTAVVLAYAVYVLWLVWCELRELREKKS